MMTNDEIAKLAREYVADVYDGGTDFIDEAENVFSWLLRTHCIVEKSKVKEAYKSARKDTRDGYKSKTGGMIVIGETKKALLESLFDAETFKDSEV